MALERGITRADLLEEIVKLEYGIADSYCVISIF